MSGPLFLAIIAPLVIIFFFVLPNGVYRFYFRSRKLFIGRKKNGDLFIRYRWFHTDHVLQVVFGLFVLGGPLVLLLTGMMPEDGTVGTKVLFWLFYPVAVLIVGFASLCGFLNQTTVYIDSSRNVFSTYGPLPSIYHKPVQLANIVAVEYEQRQGMIRRSFPAYIFSIWATDSNGNKGRLFPVIDEESHAQEIVAEIRACLATFDQSKK